MADAAVQEALVAQMARAWEMLRDASRKVPDDQWRAGEPQRLAPARLAMHCIAPAVPYGEAIGKVADDFGPTLGRGWIEADIADFPDRTETMAYLDRVKAQVEAWLRGMSLEDLLAPQDTHGHTGANRLERAIYLARHIQHHVGELNAECVRRDLPRPRWQ